MDAQHYKGPPLGSDLSWIEWPP